MSKPGRNDPCYCGSGKKYKKCHMAADKEAEEERRKLMDAARWMRRDLIRYSRDERFAESFAQALPLYWNDLYTIDNAEEMSQNEAFRFFDWFVFDYQPVEGPRLIELYHSEQYEDLSSQQKIVLDSWLNAPPAGAYELLDYDGQTLHVREFITHEECDVFEPVGHGEAEVGDLLLGRPVAVQERLEFSSVVAYLPQDEIADLTEKIESAQKSDAETYPQATYAEFMRRHGYLIIHHALDQAEKKGRPPVAARDPDRGDNLARQAAQRIRKLQRAG